MGIVPPTRMLVESDWHTAGELGERNGEMLRIVAPFLVRERVGEVKGEGESSEEELREAARLLAGNWERFDENRRGKDEDDEEEDDDDAEEDEAEEARRAFEANWWKQLKSKPMK